MSRRQTIRKKLAEHQKPLAALFVPTILMDFDFANAASHAKNIREHATMLCQQMN